MWKITYLNYNGDIIYKVVELNSSEINLFNINLPDSMAGSLSILKLEKINI